MSLKFNQAVRIYGLTPGVVLGTGTDEAAGPVVAVALADGVNVWYRENIIGACRNTPEHDAIRSWSGEPQDVRPAA